MEQQFYCYYSTQRPIDIGTFPKPPDNQPTEICNFDERMPVEHGRCMAWGILTYAKPLTEKEINDYELRPSRYNPDMRRTMAEQASFVGPWEERNNIPAAKRLTRWDVGIDNFSPADGVTPEQLAEHYWLAKKFPRLPRQSKEKGPTQREGR
jgi:hypothetical protein